MYLRIASVPITYHCKICKPIGHILGKMCNKNKNHFINVEEIEKVIDIFLRLKK